MLVINDERYQISSGTYVLEPAKEPKTITLFARLSPMRSGDRVEEAELIGIYKLEGDRLTIAFRKNGPRPEKFEVAARLGGHAVSVGEKPAQCGSPSEARRNQYGTSRDADHLSDGRRHTRRHRGHD